MQTQSTTFRSLADIPVTPIWTGLDARLVHGEQASFSVIEIAPDALAATHAHPNEQIGILLQGELIFTVGGEQRRLKPGDTWCIPGGTAHEAVGGPQGAVVVEIWAPARADFQAMTAGPARPPLWPRS